MSTKQKIDALQLYPVIERDSTASLVSLLEAKSLHCLTRIALIPIFIHDQTIKIIKECDDWWLNPSVFPKKIPCNRTSIIFQLSLGRHQSFADSPASPRWREQRPLHPSAGSSWVGDGAAFLGPAVRWPDLVQHSRSNETQLCLGLSRWQPFRETLTKTQHTWLRRNPEKPNVSPAINWPRSSLFLSNLCLN